MINTFPELGLRQWLGCAMLVVSTLTWLAVPVIVLLDMAAADKVAWAGVSYGVSLVSWWLCLVLLGPELFTHGKKLWRRLKTVLHLPAGPDR
ncbi:MAG: hypothetical protein O7F73_08370 [Gammaproteobacteria bacterium]|nr:hypothetical protein [Gammaproteobacteria bacterium]